jgi:hypothetical protein
MAFLSPPQSRFVQLNGIRLFFILLVLIFLLFHPIILPSMGPVSVSSVQCLQTDMPQFRELPMEKSWETKVDQSKVK